MIILAWSGKSAAPTLIVAEIIMLFLYMIAKNGGKQPIQMYLCVVHCVLYVLTVQSVLLVTKKIDCRVAWVDMEGLRRNLLTHTPFDNG